MYDSTIHMKTLARHVCKADFAADSSLYDRPKLEEAIGRAVELGLSGFSAISLKTNTLRGKAVHQLTDLAESLVVRHITSNIRRVTGVQQDDRQFIVTCMQKMLSEGTSFRVYKFDIESFYEHVQLEEIFGKLESDIAFSAQSVRALRSFFDQLSAIGVAGLPRGVSLSATLAEYLLRDFDRLMSRTQGVWFYARFVDDILIITDGREGAENFKQGAARGLPSGLEFNRKSVSLDFTPYRKTNNAMPEHCFDYLGYRFSVSLAHRDSAHDGKIWRDAWLDIAPSKVRKLKTRIARSLLTYSKDTNFGLLLSRLQLLTSNFNFIDLKTGTRRTSGIYFNYPLVSADKSTALPELDRYLLCAVTSPHPRNHLRPAVTSAQRQQLLNLRFQDGFRNRRFFSFSADRLVKLTACWAYA
jgi:hypothetical protein